MEEWLNKQAESILREIGIKEELRVLDFGCGSGIYSLIISKIVGNQGKVYALDYDNDKLDEIQFKCKSKTIQNIEIIKTSKEISFPVQDNSLDVILLYDVWHLLEENQRLNFIKESKRTLKIGGFISYLATHLHKSNVNLENVHALMKKNGLMLLEKFYKPMFHWSWIEEYQIFNYYRE